MFNRQVGWFTRAYYRDCGAYGDPTRAGERSGYDPAGRTWYLLGSFRSAGRGSLIGVFGRTTGLISWYEIASGFETGVHPRIDMSGRSCKRRSRGPTHSLHRNIFDAATSSASSGSTGRSEGSESTQSPDRGHRTRPRMGHWTPGGYGMTNV